MPLSDRNNNLCACCVYHRNWSCKNIQHNHNNNVIYYPLSENNKFLSYILNTRFHHHRSTSVPIYVYIIILYDGRNKTVIEKNNRSCLGSHSYTPSTTTSTAITRVPLRQYNHRQRLRGTAKGMFFDHPSPTMPLTHLSKHPPTFRSTRFQFNNATAAAFKLNGEPATTIISIYKNIYITRRTLNNSNNITSITIIIIIARYFHHVKQQSQQPSPMKLYYID